jgi:type I restriction enzyme S subunit
VVEPGIGIMSQKFVVVPGCVLLSKLNPRIPRVWIPAPANERRQIASTEFLVAVPRPEWTREFLYCLFQQGEFRDSLAQSASGTSNSHQRVRPTDLLARPLVLPPKARHSPNKSFRKWQCGKHCTSNRPSSQPYATTSCRGC